MLNFFRFQVSSPKFTKPKCEGMQILNINGLSKSSCLLLSYGFSIFFPKISHWDETLDNPEFIFEI